MPCETMKQYALVLCSRVCLLLYTVSKERKEADTQRACRCFHILCFFFVFFFSCVLLLPHFKDQRLLTRAPPHRFVLHILVSIADLE